MTSILSHHTNIISIRQAAIMLGVSLHTLRRWEKKGLLHTVRPDGGSRYFFVGELQKIKSDQSYTISQAAAFLGLSVSTLRRLERRGLLCSQRSVNKRRLYCEEDLRYFQKSKLMK
jgi:DNA-binding transcriptional MerR regulator